MRSSLPEKPTSDDPIFWESFRRKRSVFRQSDHESRLIPVRDQSEAAVYQQGDGLAFAKLSSKPSGTPYDWEE